MILRQLLLAADAVDDAVAVAFVVAVAVAVAVRAVLLLSVSQSGRTLCGTTDRGLGPRVAWRVGA